MKHITALILFGALVSVSVFAQNAVDEETIELLHKRSNAFIGLIYQGDYEEAFDYIRAYPKAIGDEMLDSLETSAAEQLERFREVYGEKLDAQYLGLQPVSNFLVREVYAIRHERHFTWWELLYYRGAGDEWMCLSVSFNSDQEALFELMF